MVGTFAWIEGFDDYPADSGTAGIGMASYWFQASSFYPGGFQTGRFGNKAALIPYSNQAIYRGVPSCVKAAGGLAIFVGNLGICPNNGGQLFAFRSTNNNDQFNVGVDNLGNIRVNRSSDFTTPMGISDKPIVGNCWNYFEFEYVMSDTVGEFRLWINGRKTIDISAVDTKNSADADIGRFLINCPSGGGNTCLYDDMYFISGDDVKLGECRALLMSVAADDAVAWSRLGGATNASQIDEVLPDGDTSYNYSNTVGQEDYFPLPALAGNPTAIYAFQLTLVARKDDSGTRTVAPLMKINGNEHQLADLYQTTNYTFQRTILTQNPETNAPWVKNDFAVGNIKVGYKLTA